MTFKVPERDSLRTVPSPPDFCGELGDSNYSVQLSPVPRNLLVAGQFYFKARVDPDGKLSPIAMDRLSDWPLRGPTFGHDAASRARPI